MASILIVEDVPAVLLSLRLVLEGHGHQIASATNGKSALTLLADNSFDLVITDIWMPGSSGTEVIREGRKRSPRTRFLAITGGDPNSNSDSGVLRHEDYGAEEVLLKPFDKTNLLGAVSRLLENFPS